MKGFYDWKRKETATKAFSEINEKYLYFISRPRYSEPVKRQADIDGATLLKLDDLFI